MAFRDLPPLIFKAHTKSFNSGRVRTRPITFHMGNLPARWNALVIMLALATLVGCQGFSTSKPASQGEQDSTQGTLSAPSSVSFGNVQTGTSQTLSETLSNTGGSSLTITQAIAAGAGFSISGLTLPVTLTVGQSVPFKVTFAPQSLGNFTGSVSVLSDASNPSLSISLSGSGTEQQAQGVLGVSPATISVGNVTVGSSGTQTGTLNATAASVTVSSVNVDSSEFVINGLSFPVTITAGQSVNFTVTFTPQTVGAVSGNVSFISDASNSPTGATVTGTGVAQSVHTVNLSWTASNSPDVVGYNVYRRTGTTGTYGQINTVLDATTEYIDGSVADGQTYYYETTAVNSSNEESARSNSVQAVIPPS
jgi:Abnormal spindle-like microcephaly-assoc'd, ASPM-SPD-2-Hydin